MSTHTPSPTDPFATIAWLAGHLGDPALVVLDATLPPVGATPVIDTKARYEARHIPGAVFFDIEALSDQSTTLPHMLPPPESFAQSMAALGVGDAMTLVVYEAEGVFSAPRAWWMLRTMGAKNVRVLDGDLRAWIEAGHATESGAVARPRAAFRATPDRHAVRSFEEMQQLIREGGQILDARSAGRFAGTAPEPRPSVPSGGMPGAINVPYTELLQGGRMADAEQLTALFGSRGIDLRRPIATSCGSGITAAVLSLGLER